MREGNEWEEEKNERKREGWEIRCSLIADWVADDVDLESCRSWIFK